MAVFARSSADFPVNLLPGSMIQSIRGPAIHVGILLGYPRDFIAYLTDDELEGLNPVLNIQYMINLRNGGGGCSGASGCSGSAYCAGGIQIEEVCSGFLNGVAPCAFAGERETLENTIKKGIELWRDPGEWTEYDVRTRNCQHFATFIATEGDYRGLVLDQRINIHSLGETIGAVMIVGSILLAPGWALLPLGLVGWGIGFGFQASRPRIHTFNQC